MSERNALPASFRDPAGFLFKKDHTLYRQVNVSYAADYDLLMSSGLYDALVKAGLLIPHTEVELSTGADNIAYKVLKPEIVRTVSYPHEWCFSQLKDAALATIKIQGLALRYGMVLKDASAYNIQFHEGAATFIDTLSFTTYREGEPWIAYKQFCQHFLAPLALMSYTDSRLSQLFRIYIDGIPLDLTSRLLPKRTYFKYSLLSHIHLHAKVQARYADSKSGGESKKQAQHIGVKAFAALPQELHNTVRKLKWQLPDTEWGEYYSATNYQDQSMRHKETLVSQFLRAVKPVSLVVHDLGANNGHFSRIAASQGFDVVSQDIDPVAVEKNYLQSKIDGEKNILPLLLDLTNPSPALGWSLSERMSFMERIEGRIVLALALVHHLAISNNVPLSMIAEFFSQCAEYLIIEFVPKSDSQVQRLLTSRIDIFDDYTQEHFESKFAEYFSLQQQTAIEGSARTLYLMKHNENQ